MKSIIYFISIFFMLNGYIYSQVFSGTTAAQFLKIEVGAKSIGMGGAFVSLTNDVSTIYWNPAGIARLNNSAASFTHSRWLADTKHNFAGVVIKLNDQHAIGLSYTSLTMPDMKVTNEFYQDGTGEFFSATDYALGLSYGLNITDNFSIGFTGKFVGQSIWHMTASTIAFDVGVHYITPFEGLHLGMSVSNIGGKMKYEGKDNFINYTFDPNQSGNSQNVFAEIKLDEWDLPLMFRVGMSMQLIKTNLHSITISADALHPNDYTESVNTGFEYGFHERVFLRVGYKSLFKEESEEGLTAGLGVLYYLTDYVPVRVDYAYADFGRLNSVHRFSVEVGF